MRLFCSRWWWGPAAGPAMLAVTVATASPATAHSAATGDVRHQHITRQMAVQGYQIHGMVLSEANRPFLQNVHDIPRLAHDGVNTLNLYITQYQASKTANRITSGVNTPSGKQVRQVIAAAHKHDMAVELMPIVWTNAPFIWRGDYHPSHPGTWFRSYTAMIDHWARVGQRAGAEFFAVGSEYQSLEKYVSRWRAVAASVRQVYKGETTYMATAGSYQSVKFWSSVDDIGVSPYFSLSRAKVPSVSSLVKVWRSRIFPALQSLSGKENRRILFDEVGYESVEHAAYHPYSHNGGTPSQPAQANAYQAVMDATAGQSFLRGSVFFGWDPLATQPSDDTSYSPRQKLAECAVARSWSAKGQPLPPQCSG